MYGMKRMTKWIEFSFSKTCISCSLRYCLYWSRYQNAHEWMSIWRVYGLITHHYRRIHLLFIPWSRMTQALGHWNEGVGLALVMNWAELILWVSPILCGLVEMEGAEQPHVACRHTACDWSGATWGTARKQKKERKGNVSIQYNVGWEAWRMLHLKERSEIANINQRICCSFDALWEGQQEASLHTFFSCTR